MGRLTLFFLLFIAANTLCQSGVLCDMPLKLERTLAIIKPDGVTHSDVIQILIRDAGFHVLAMKIIQLDMRQALHLYEKHLDRKFFRKLIEFMMSIRAFCGTDAIRNCVHGSESPEFAAREIEFFFGKEYVISKSEDNQDAATASSGWGSDSDHFEL
ncbi:nucleoside diphosphate kinase isoform X3 [Amborella trichopoda]|uniref:nucleoside diphosphate kinase isoform X3 n=1 Tax=Amborella trichopoda TaxID=13333 RepID=UPI0009BF2AFD|nr:nucleoside diphosphate kinase isoform X3 [Amborella trichopoda]|eukprot:XP_020518780.1 nucleoside diphosphate kinase isoform X3 [Amborella trichopoda]